VKKIIHSLLLSVGILFGQSFTFTPETHYIEADSGFVQFDCEILNQTGRNLGLRAIRLANDMPDNWISSLCVGISCYPPETDTVEFYIPGNGATHFSLDVTLSAENPGTGTFLIRIENGSDTSDATIETFIATNNPSAVSSSFESPNAFILLPAFPNPFNPAIRIPFHLKYQSEVLRLSIIDSKGRLVWHKTLRRLEAGYHEIQWSGVDLFGKQLPSGIYLYQLQSAESTSKRKITLLK
jgi:hypothetical protein